MESDTINFLSAGYSDGGQNYYRLLNEDGEEIAKAAPTDSYYYDAVFWALKNGVTTGITETLFGPDGDCTRAQMVTFLWRAMGEPEAETKNNPFTDVEEGSYYEEAVIWAYENGITNGMTATTFGPNNNCTRAHAVTLLYRAFN